METFAQRLKRLRKAKRFSQKKLAELIGSDSGFHQQIIALLEKTDSREKRRLTLVQWEQLADALDVSPAYLAFGSESEKVKNPEQDNDTPEPERVAA